MNIFDFNCFKQPESTENYKRTLFRDDEPLTLTPNERVDFLRYLEYTCPDSVVYTMKTGLCAFNVLKVRMKEDCIMFKLQFRSSDEKARCTDFIDEYTPPSEASSSFNKRTYYIKMFEWKKEAIRPLYGISMDIIRPYHVINIVEKGNQVPFKELYRRITDVEILV